jgi:hypothetical protein
MPSYMLRDLPPGLVQRAKARAREEGTTLDAVLRRMLEVYVESGRPGVAGGEARADRLSAEERSDIARKAAEARWKKVV